jgi:hypothetical protein
MQIPVIKNPVAKSSNGARRKKPMAKKRRRAASPAQLAARKKFAAKYGGKKRKAAPSRPKARRRKRTALSLGRHRPVVIRKRAGLYRPKRSTLRPHATFKNPFLGGLAMIGNPRRRKARKGRKSHRRSRRSVSIFRNPIGGSLSAITSAPKQMISKDFLTEAASVSVGFVLPNIVMTYLPANLRDARWKGYASKVAVVAVLAGASGMVSKRVSKAILLGGGVSLLLDLYADFVAPMLHGGGAPAPGGTAAFFGEEGDPGMGAFFGNDNDPGAGLGDGRAIGEAFA